MEIVLSKPSLPSDLDEAADMYAPDLPSYNIGIGYLPPQSREDLRIAFKDGAEWMRGQGETYTTHVEDASNDEERFPAIFVPVDSFKPGNKVIVQIRKKY